MLSAVFKVEWKFKGIIIFSDGDDVRSFTNTIYGCKNSR